MNGVQFVSVFVFLTNISFNFLQPSPKQQFNSTAFTDTIPASSPAVITLPPDSITISSARLHAFCDPKNQQVKLCFLCGLTQDTYELRTESQYPGNDTIPAEITCRVTNLIPNTTYYVVAEAQSVQLPAIRVRGTPQVFTTCIDPYMRSFTISLEIKNRFGEAPSKPLLFGVHSDATYCRDIGLGEHELPPPPPDGVLEIRFIDVHNMSDCMGLGLATDLRHYYSIAQVDTYMVRIQPDYSGYPLILSWPSLTNHYAGQVRLCDVYSGTLWNTDMKLKTSDTLTLPLDRLLIIAEGPMNLIGVKTDAVTSTGVSLIGSFNPRGSPTTAWFEWSDSTTIVHTTQEYNLGNDTTPVEFSHQLTNLNPASLYHFRAVIQNSVETIIGSSQDFKTHPLSLMAEESNPPTTLIFYPNFPNPFNPVTMIRYYLPARSHVVLKLYDMLGKEVRTLADETLIPGEHSVSVGANGLSAGVYFCTLNVGSFSATKKILLIK